MSAAIAKAGTIVTIAVDRVAVTGMDTTINCVLQVV
jgi:hypothetical protein